jgi:hypothetical protein
MHAQQKDKKLKKGIVGHLATVVTSGRDVIQC